MEQKHPTRLVTSSLWSQYTPYVRVCGDTDVSMPTVAGATHVTEGHTEPLSYAIHICVYSHVATTKNSLYWKLSYISCFFKRLFFLACFETGSLAHAGLDFPQ